jgi:hypothetical protein
MTKLSLDALKKNLRFTKYLDFSVVMVVIVRYLDLLLPMQSVLYNHKHCEFEAPSWQGVLDTTLCDKVCQ